MSDFKGRHFEGEIVLWAVRWYCRYGVSYRDPIMAIDAQAGSGPSPTRAGMRSFRRTLPSCSVSSARRWTEYRSR